MIIFVKISSKQHAKMHNKKDVSRSNTVLKNIFFFRNIHENEIYPFLFYLVLFVVIIAFSFANFLPFRVRALRILIASVLLFARCFWK